MFKNQLKTATAIATIMLVAHSSAVPTITDLSARQRYPWNGLVDVSFTLAPGAWRYDLSLTATNTATGEALPVATVYPLGGAVVGAALRFAPGETHLVWDAGADVPESVIETVALEVTAVPVAEPVRPLYVVVDLSGGANATSYPVHELYAAPAGGFNTEEYKTTKLVVRRIDAGTFTMGSPEGEIGRWNYEDQHQVTLTQPFYIGVFELTQKQWELVMGSNPSAHTGDARPVECVSYNDIRGSSAGAGWPATDGVDATSFMGRLRSRTGCHWDLPTEAQWEYACRAGTTTALNSGENLTDSYNDFNMAATGRYYYNQSDGKGGYSKAHTTVGSYAPNAWGLYDMHGNVWEWSRDWGSDNLGFEAVTDPNGVCYGSTREIRGGSWDNYSKACRSACRSSDNSPSAERNTLGFRISMSPSEGLIHFEKIPYDEEPTTLSLDTRTGVRRAAAVEGIVYDTAWCPSGTLGILATADDGSLALSEDAPANGVAAWNTAEAKAGLRTLSLLADRDTLYTAQFAVRASYLALETEGAGTLSAESGWFAVGTMAITAAMPGTHWHFSRWAGDTNGCRVAGATIRAPMTADRTIRAVFERDLCELRVTGGLAGANPPDGIHALPKGVEAEAKCAPEATLGDGVRAVCAGWSGTGSIPAEGTGTNLVFTPLLDSTLAWRWTTNYLVRVTVVGNGTTDFSEAWVERSGTLVVTAAPGASACAGVSWSGDVDGAAVDGLRIEIPGDRPRNVVVTFEALGIGQAVEQPRRTWMTDGEATWTAVAEGAHDGVDAARSGTVGGGDYGESTLSAVFVGPGDLSFWWKIETGDAVCGVDVLVNGVAAEPYLAAATDWTQTMLALPAGEHTVVWSFWSDGSDETAAAWLDQMAYSSAGGRTETQTTPEPVPYGWLDEFNLGDGTENGYEAAALSSASNGVYAVWECYVAGLSPTDEAARFEARIGMVDGAPVVTWAPDLNEGGTKAERVYTVEGKASLRDAWGPTNAASRFFRVKVALP